MHRSFRPLTYVEKKITSLLHATMDHAVAGDGPLYRTGLSMFLAPFSSESYWRETATRCTTEVSRHALEA